MGREVAAVHRRNVGRNERRKRLRVVPVIEVATIPLQRLHRAQCVRRAQNELSGRKIPKVMRRQVGEQRQPHIGRRRATRDRDRRLLLHVVRWQPVVVRTHIHFEIRPRAACKLAQEMHLLERQLRAAPHERAAHPPGDCGRGRPKQQDGAGDRQRHGFGCGQADPRERGDCRGDPHGAVGRKHVRAIAFQPALHLARSIPFEQATLRDQHPP